MFEIDIPDGVREMLEKLARAGFEAWLVGGCVRDALLGRRPSDYDIATGAAPGRTAALFSRAVATGGKYGTLTVFEKGARAEITAFRAEGTYSDGRRPDSVRFGVGLREDLMRRDFTVNAMAYSPDRGLYDPFGGEADLEARLLRAVGSPEERFREDALRILRAFRFSAQLGFGIEPGTRAAIEKTASLAGRVSRERIRGELQKLLLSPRPGVIFDLFRSGVGCGVFDAEKLAKKDAGAGILADTPPEPGSRWAGFFALGGFPPPQAESRMKALRFDNATLRQTAALLRELEVPLPETRAALKRRLAEGGPALFRAGLLLRQALFGADIAAAEKLLAGVLQSGEPYRTNMLALGGNDLLALGVPPGPAMGALLGEMLLAVVDRPGLNTRDALAAWVRARQNRGSPGGR